MLPTAGAHLELLDKPLMHHVRAAFTTELPGSCQLMQFKRPDCPCLETVLLHGPLVSSCSFMS